MLCSFCIFGNVKIKNCVYPYCSRIHVSTASKKTCYSRKIRIFRCAFIQCRWCTEITSAKWVLTVSSRIFFDTAPLIYDILTFTIPFIAPLVISIAVIPDFIFLPLAITAALIAGVLSLLVSWTEEKKARQKSKKDAIEKNPICVEISFHCAFCF